MENPITRQLRGWCLWGNKDCKENCFLFIQNILNARLDFAMKASIDAFLNIFPKTSDENPITFHAFIEFSIEKRHKKYSNLFSV